jgi:trypsin
MNTLVSRPRRLLALLAFAAATVPAAPAAAQDVSARVVGGTSAAAGDYPWQAAMIYSGFQYCGGTLVDDDWVLTAAHCDVWVGDQVRIGSIDRTTGGELLDVVEVSNHPLADGQGDPPRNDVTMVRLEQAVTNPRPLAIVTPGSEDGLWAAGDVLTATGWGATSEGGASTDTLQEVELPRIADATCGDSYSDFDSADMVCAGYPEGGKDTCQGDSGGPLIAPANAAPDKSDPADWRLVGDTSWGVGCARAGLPGVYGRLGNPRLRDWTSTTPPVAATPVLSGGAYAGEAVSCARGTWTTTAYFTYRFFRQGSSGGPTQVASSTSGTYVLRAEDVGASVFCRVRGENAAGAAESGESNAVAVSAAPVATNTRPPAIVGEPVVGRQLRCEPGAWNGATTLSYAFRRVAPDGTTTPASSGSTTYVPSLADVGLRIVCVETAGNAAGDAEASSSPVGPVVAPDAPEPPEWREPTPTPTPLPPPPPPPPVQDTARPRALVVGRRCLGRRCTIRAAASDPAPSAGVRSVTARIAYKVRRRCGRRLCTRTVRRTFAATRLGSLFVVRTPRLPKGLWTVRLTAADNAGNAQAVPTVVRLRVR